MPVSPIVVEDGSGVATANSYVTLNQIKQWLSDGGFDYTSTCNDDLTVAAYAAKNYLEGLDYQGSKTTTTQPLQYPRTGTQINCVDFADDAIPQELKNAQMELVKQSLLGVDINPTVDGGFVIKEKVDVIEREFSEKVGYRTTPKMPSVENWLNIVLYPCGKGRGMKTLRV